MRLFALAAVICFIYWFKRWVDKKSHPVQSAKQDQDTQQDSSFKRFSPFRNKRSELSPKAFQIVQF
ncbi:uncharacterized protein ACHE_11025S [Aspergillus chevalieri]|uniref:Uncharacterized protein n=1 Tax=Aspergillus chevalieri TaxID=182096 RepID=A0A7R7VF85_ASPCH|nr:uncharacterized protein ACHE_11025S [Aspergillus chevalieri]BCR83623.1 hypothetical protein ACHE_11025S [Aspergillus chevalieri]